MFLSDSYVRDVFLPPPPPSSLLYRFLLYLHQEERYFNHAEFYKKVYFVSLLRGIQSHKLEILKRAVNFLRLAKYYQPNKQVNYLLIIGSLK
jgi:hypothetical protein